MMEQKLEVTNLITPIINGFKAISNEWKNLLDIGLTEYLVSQTEKYYFTNTFLHRGDKVVFRDIYYPLTASYKKLVTDFQNPEELFQTYKNITLIGSAGSGKTTLVKHIFLKSLSNKKQIPLIIELRYLNDYNGNFESLITDKILKTNLKPSRSILERTLKSGGFLFLLDGYDEVYSVKKQEVNRQIETFMDSYSLNNFIITTRPGSGIESFPRFYDFCVDPLDDKAVEGFLSKIVTNTERHIRISKIITNSKNNYKEYLRNPLLLSMFIMAFESHPEIPSKKSSFYRNVFDTLYSKHDGFTKNSFPREKKTNLERHNFENILSAFSFLTFNKGEFAFTEEGFVSTLNSLKPLLKCSYDSHDLLYDLRTTISIILLDGYEYKFPHRSMQEYFSAVFLETLPHDKKIKAYEKLSQRFKKLSNDRSTHFWSLCQELDEFDFTQYFLIPELIKLEKALYGETDEDILKKYLKTFRLVFLKNNFSKTNGLAIGRFSNSNTLLVNFCKISNFTVLAKCWGSPEMAKIISQEMDNRVKKNGEETIFIIKEDNYKTLLKHPSIDIIKKQRELILSKINYLKQEAKNNKTNIDDIFGF